ncbi:peptidase S8/S53 domain-containing protein [Phycomyces blakesleeanus]|uniref:Peptidase S8/S53 domain-containing protein n=2 Tax=Phycomyces blakesleeanus TaxID=4837 RepID=A0A167QHD5_PHYB8|nr:hypothetical protein PHYBLDRAFT_162756 [Phycomyces blakesleeanus NRRL 1555(-)]OAD79699.1 hypothetical protein PHYBLDRAFT_162756 [Phycomyces blakesleeanus NRRL 1555(-)]|eukprot:XP_018297739.1 hypothetical protein PHYBLDRAFT_162756 [Phycomyces blakesleeanus NRRL 1555(-)]
MLVGVIDKVFAFTGNRIIKNSYVIEFSEPKNADSRRELFQERRLNFYEDLKTYNISHIVRQEYMLMNAVSVKFDSEKDAMRYFTNGENIKRIWPVSSIPIPDIYPPTYGNPTTDLFDTYGTTGVTRVREIFGFEGEGIKIGVIDSGIDFLHPALGGCYGKGCKVAYGYDFVGNNYNGENNLSPNNYPRDVCNGHGTHVAGIIGANDVAKNFTGIAPKVTLGAYKIFGCTGSTTDDVIMKALEKAFTDGMDIINLSIGDMGWPESPVAIMADMIALQGVTVLASAGNEGDQGFFKVNVPALEYVTPMADSFNLLHSELVFASKRFLDNRDGCSQLFNLDKKVVVIAAGGCNLDIKILNAQRAGAAAVLIYTTSIDAIIPRTANKQISIPFGGVAIDDAEYLWDFLNVNPGYTTDFPKGNIVIPVKRANTISPFSSWGLGPDLSIKPDISAPGGDIFSTYPLTMGGYTTMSGTSMACPYASGIVALLHESYKGLGEINTDSIRTIVINNGSPYNMFKTNTPETIARQGGGLINIEKMLGATTLIFPEQIRLNDKNKRGTDNLYTITIKNYDTKPVIYRFSHMPAGAAQGYGNNYSPGNPFPLANPILLKNHEVEAFVNFPVEYLEIPAKEKADLIIHISLPPLPAYLPPTIYSGFIVIQSDNKNLNQYIPYAGLTTDIYTLPVLNINQTSPYISSQTAKADQPVAIVAKMIEASPLVAVMVVSTSDPNIVYGLVPDGINMFTARNDPSNSADNYIIYWNGIIQRRIPGETFNPSVNPRNPRYGRLKAGYYRLRIMALRVFGNPEIAEDYDTWTSPEIYYE